MKEPIKKLFLDISALPAAEPIYAKIAPVVKKRIEDRSGAVCLENQENADRKLAIFSKLPIKHKCITAQPLIGATDMERHLDGIELVVVGGESDQNARPLDYSWVLDIREQCIRKNVSFEFRQCGTHFIKDGKEYKLQTKDLCSQARKAGINFKAHR